MPEITLPLQLIPASARSSELIDSPLNVAAWLIPIAGTTQARVTEVVIDEVVSWNVPTSQLRYRIIGRRAPTSAIWGVLVTGAPSVSSRNAIPWTKRANLYLPVNSRLFPAVDDQELSMLLSSYAITDFAWHPTAGLIGFDREDELTTADLLSAPDFVSDRLWQVAEPSLRLNDRIRSVQAIVQLDINQILHDGQDDIGTESDLRKAPRAAGEHTFPTLTDIARNIRNKLSGLFSGNPSKKTDGGFRESLQSLSSGLSARQENELKRLMNLLSTNPDQGLKYALPFGGDAFRGLVNGGDQLPTHNTDFSLARTSGPAAVWDIPWQYQQQLRQKYSELAAREIQLGRYRRAAYIYSSLLNDDAAAAKTLKQGGFYREAAVIYRDRLKQQRQAAECLRDGGLWQEAIDEFVELGQWSEVAKIYERLDQPQEADQSWQHEIDELIKRQEFRAAAEVQETRRHNVVAAADCLKAGWTQQMDHCGCLQKLFDLHSRHGNHCAAADDLVWLMTTCESQADRAADASEVLAPFHQRYPDHGVRQQIHEMVIRLSAAHLRTHASGLQNRFLKSLRALHPEDRLLTRDCDRYARTTVVDWSQQLSTRRRQDMWTESHSVELGQSVRWKTATLVSDQLVAAGYRDNKIVLSRCRLRDEQATALERQWNLKSLARTPLLLAGRAYGNALFVHRIDHASMADLECTWGQPSIEVKTAPMPTETTHAIHVTQNGTVMQLDVNWTSTWLRLFDNDEQLVQSVVLPSQIGEALEVAVSQTRHCVQLAATQRFIYIGIGQILIKADRNELEQDAGFDLQDYSETIQQLAPAPLSMGAELLACHSEGAMLMTETSFQPIGFGLAHPKAGWLSPTAFALVDRNGSLETYEVKDHQARLVGIQTTSAKNPIGIYTTHRNRLAILSDSGTLMEFRR